MERCPVTVVIPCYRQEHYLDESVGSVLAQTCPPAAVHIVDDGSDTPEKASHFQRILALDSRIRVIAKPNGGLSSARNAGIRECETPFVLPLDADDQLHPEFLARTSPHLSRNPRLGFVYTWLQCFEDDEMVWQCPPFDPARLLRRNLLAHCTLFRRAMWEDIGGYDETFLTGMEDWDFWISAVEKGWAGACVPEILFFYRVRRDSMLQSLTTQRPIRRAILARLLEKHAAVYRHLPELADADAWCARMEDEERNPGGDSFTLAGRSGLYKAVRKTSLAAGYARARTRRRDRRLLMEVPALREGGMEQMALQLAAGLGRLGIDTTFLCTDEPGPWGERALRDGHRLRVLGDDKHREFLQVVAAENPALLMAHGSRLCTPWAVRAFLPVVWTVHALHPWWHPEDWRLVREMLPEVTHVIAVSDTAAACFARQTGLTRDQVRTIPNGIEPPPERPGIGFASPVRLLMAGRYHPAKGHALGLEALADLRRRGHRATLTAFGPVSADPWHHRHLMERAAALGLADDVALRDAAEWSPARYAEADIVLMPSVAEGFGLVAAEAAAAGLPVVMTDTGCVRELRLAGAQLEVVPPPLTAPLDYTVYQIAQYAWPEDAPAALADAVERVLNESPAHACGAVEYVRRAFSLRTMAEDYAGLLRGLLP